MTTQVNRKMSSVYGLEYDLQDEGYYLLGQGFFSKVFAHPDKPDEVLKMTCTCNLGWEYMDGWLRYLFGFVIIDEAYQSPHTPIVYDVTIYEDGYTARMERLAPISGNEYWSALNLPFIDEIRAYDDRTDLHQANIMKRVDPETGWECIVVTDPYC